MAPPFLTSETIWRLMVSFMPRPFHSSTERVPEPIEGGLVGCRAGRPAGPLQEIELWPSSQKPLLFPLNYPDFLKMYLFRANSETLRVAHSTCCE
jgi:hypothetical protein